MDLNGAHTPARQPLKINICLLLPWSIIRGPDFPCISASLCIVASINLPYLFCIVPLINLYLFYALYLLSTSLDIVSIVSFLEPYHISFFNVPISLVSNRYHILPKIAVSAVSHLLSTTESIPECSTPICPYLCSLLWILP